MKNTKVDTRKEKKEGRKDLRDWREESASNSNTQRGNLSEHWMYIFSVFFSVDPCIINFFQGGVLLLMRYKNISQPA